MKTCFSCGRPLQVPERIGRTETCPFCEADLKCCQNCIFYDPGAYNQCRETQAERVLDKDRSNYCDFFVFNDRPQHRHTVSANQKEHKNPLDRLFKK